MNRAMERNLPPFQFSRPQLQIIIGLLVGFILVGLSLLRQVDTLPSGIDAKNRINGTLLTLAAYHCSQDYEGQWPETLDALIPDYLDPLDGLSDYHYRVRKTGENLPWTYLRPQEALPAPETVILQAPVETRGQPLEIRFQDILNQEKTKTLELSTKH